MRLNNCLIDAVTASLDATVLLDSTSIYLIFYRCVNAPILDHVFEREDRREHKVIPGAG
jgi:hypothetical protein